MVSTQQLQELGQKVSSGPEVLLVPIMAFIAPVQGILITVAAVILLDTAMGVWKAFKNNLSITSRRFSAILSKILLYEVVILTTFAVDHFIAGELIFFSDIENVITKVVSLIVICIELKSIDENFTAVRGASLWSTFKNLVTRSSEIKDDIKKITKP